MRLCVTLPSHSAMIDRIYTYCQQHSIVMRPAQYISVDSGYYTWRIEIEPSAELTWLLIQFGEHLVEF